MLCLGLIFVCWCDFLCPGGILLPWVILFGYVVTWWMTSSLYGGHVNLGMIFLRLVWIFCLGVILYVLLSFYTLIGVIYTLMRSTESWYGVSPPRLKFLFWCDFVCLGVILYLDTINWILVWFFFALAKFFVLVWFGVVLYLVAINGILVWCFSFW